MCAIPYVQPCGGYCLQRETSDERQTAYITSSHTRDGVLSCKGVILRCLITTVVSTGFMIQPHPRLVAWNRQTQCPHSKTSANSRNSVPRNILDPIPSASRGNSSSASHGNSSSAACGNASSAPRGNLSRASHKKNSSAPRPGNSVHSHSQRGSPRKNNENKMSAIATRGPLAVPPSPAPPKKCRIRRRRQAQRAANRNSGIIPATPLTQDARWANQSAAGHAGATPTQPEDIDPTSTMRTAVYPPSRIVGNSGTNENSPFQIGLESSRNPGLYKPTIPDTQLEPYE